MNMRGISFFRRFGIRQLIAATLACVLLLSFSAFAEESKIRMDFEDGFSLELPSDWVTFEVPETLEKQGIVYVLGKPDATRIMYIQLWDTHFETLDALELSMAKREDIELRTQPEDGFFLIYGFKGEDVSGCMTLHNGHVLNLMFAPQSDPDGMAIAATVMESCRWVEVDLGED